MAIESKNLLVAVKAFARGNPLPLDKDEVWGSLDEAKTYAKSSTAYAGQTIKALVNGEYKSYVLNGSAGAYTLKEIGVATEDLKQYVQIVETLPESGQEEGVIYLSKDKGYIWKGSQFVEIFDNIDWSESINTKAPINNPVFTGKVTLAADPTTNLEAVTKQYVDRLINGLVSSTPGIVDGENPLPTNGYKAGQMWRVALAGTYAGQKCEIGDLIICVGDFNTSYKDSDFIVVQTNIDGAVTGGESSVDANIVVFDGITGKKIKDSTISLASLQDTITKAHEHSNKDILDSFDKSQTDLLATVDKKITASENKINTSIDGKLKDVYTKAEVDEKLTPITENLNTKVGITEVNQAIGQAKPTIVQEAKTYTDGKVGEIPEGTSVKEYVDNAVGSGGVDTSAAIAQAKKEAIQESKNYTDSALNLIIF